MFGYFRYPFGFGYYPFGFGYPISPNSIPVRIFDYFGSDFGSDFSDRVRVPLGYRVKCPPSTSYVSNILTIFFHSWINILFCVYFRDYLLKLFLVPHLICVYDPKGKWFYGYCCLCNKREILSLGFFNK